MKKFITKIAFILLPLVILTIGLEVALRQLPNDYKNKKLYLDAHANEIETLILGNSHSFEGVNPDYFSSNTFNASYVAQSLDFDYEIVKKYKDEFRNLKTIVLPLSYLTMWAKTGIGPASWRIKDYVIHYDMPNDYSVYRNFEVLSLKPKININRIITYHLKGQPITKSSELGWATTNPSSNPNNIEETGKLHSTQHTRDNVLSEESKALFEEHLKILQELIDWCTINDVNILMFTPPALPEYKKHLNQEQLDLTIQVGEKIALENNNVLYVNLLNSPDYIVTDYFDADHMNEIGAKKLSIYINSLLNTF